jgi:hypothetical protein
MLAYFGQQPINKDLPAILHAGCKTTGEVVHLVTRSNELASRVIAIDREIESLNNLEAYIAECRNFYGPEYRAQDFEIKLSERPAKLEALQAERKGTALSSIEAPAILSIAALQRLENYPTEISIKAVAQGCLAPIKEQIEPSAVQSLVRIIQNQFAGLTLVEVAHVLNKFIAGEVKIFGKVGVNDITVLLHNYQTEKQAILEAEAEGQHLSAKQARSQGELNAAMAETRDRLKRAQQEKQDLAEAKRWAQKEQTKQSYLQSYTNNPE